MMINCLVVDDEPIARAGLLEHIRQIDFLNCVAECKSAVEASAYLSQKNIDLIFLDIQMPKMSGIDFVKNLQYPPLVVFTTAYPNYAIEGYELDILDYLLKPISFARFFKTALKAQSYLDLKNSQRTTFSSDYFFIKSNQKIEKIMILDVLYIEGMSNYIIVHAKQRKYISYLTFKGIEDQLPQDQFIRIHKSFLVSIHSIQSIDVNNIIMENGILPIGKSFKDDVMNRINDRMFKR